MAEQGKVHYSDDKRLWVHLGKWNLVYLQADGIQAIRECHQQILVILL